MSRGAGGERLAKYLAHAGIAARRRAEAEYIAAGRVSVNGMTTTDPATRVAPGDEVRVDGRILRPEPVLTFAVHKPVGVVSAARDPRGRACVVDLVPDAGVRLYPVGRLDTDSEGLILVTNDGALAQALLHPRRGVPREYAALVRPRPGAAALLRLEAGVMLSDGPARAEAVRLLTRPPGGVRPEPVAAAAQDAAWLTLVLREGRNREARRMLAAVGCDALRLVRVRFGHLRLDRLPVGRARRLSADDVAGLWADAGRDGGAGRAAANTRRAEGPGSRGAGANGNPSDRGGGGRRRPDRPGAGGRGQRPRSPRRRRRGNAAGAGAAR